MIRRTLAAWLCLTLARQARAQCWQSQDSRAAIRVSHALIRNASRNLRFDYGPKTFDQIKDRGVVVANGTFFRLDTRRPQADVIIDGRLVYGISPSRRFQSADGRLIDLGQRWGLGITRQGEPEIASGDEALAVMRDYLGGGALLLKDGVDRSAENYPRGGIYGPSFPPDVLDKKAGRTALGIKSDKTLILINVPWQPQERAATLKEIVALAKDLGAVDAVLYDGGGATAFSVGLPGAARELEVYPRPTESLNPTHIVIKACE